MYARYIKPFFDFTVGVVILILSLPLTFPVFIILFLSNRGSPLFYQRRPGKYKKIFNIVKFKTMNDRKDAEGNLLPDAQRLTTIGKLVRKTSLDEIPQLLNVIKGDMSLVGPRPLLPEYLPLYNEDQQRRHEVKPGITGWAQVNGRNAISWEEKFKLDVWYVDNLSFLLDIKILWLTILKVVRSEGVAQEGEATVQYFKGND